MGTQTRAQIGKERMKALRAERKQWVDGASAVARETRKELTAVRSALEGPGATVPEIAESTGLGPDRVLWLLASMKKFGELAEMDKEGDYYRYGLIVADEPEIEDSDHPEQ